MSQDKIPYISVSQDYLNTKAEYIIDILNNYDINIDFETAVSLLNYLDMMLVKNNQLNLTAIRDFDKGIVLHIADSLLYYKSIMKFCSLSDIYYNSEQEVVECDEDESVITLLDMGSGAGLPGIPLALIEPSIYAVLCDSTKKKMAAVQEFIDQLHFGDRVSTCSERVEALPTIYQEGFTVVTARAMGRLPILLEYASPLLVEDGILVVSKGEPDKQEMSSAQKAARIVGMELIDSQDYELPEDMGHRVLLTYSKIEEPSIELPRPIGMAASHPLG